MPITDPRQVEILKNEIPFPVPYPAKATTAGEIRIGFTQPVNKIDDLV